MNQGLWIFTYSIVNSIGKVFWYFQCHLERKLQQLWEQRIVSLWKLICEQMNENCLFKQVSLLWSIANKRAWRLNAKYRRTKSPDKNAAVFKISADFSAIIFIIIYFLSPILRKIILILISLRDFLNYKSNFQNFSLRIFELKNKGKVILNCFGLL